jgi:hypothetical protein
MTLNPNAVDTRLVARREKMATEAFMLFYAINVHQIGKGVPVTKILKKTLY